MKTFDELAKKNGTVEWEGETLAYLDQAFLCGDSDESHQLGDSYYKAYLVTRREMDEWPANPSPTHKATWEIIREGCEDESDACDWDDITITTLS